MWRDFVANLYHPLPGEQRTECAKCKCAARYALPEYLAEEGYVYFGAGVIALSLLCVTAIDAPILVVVNAGLSLLLAWSGLIALLMWTRTRVRS